VPGYGANGPVYVNQVNQDQLYRMNAGVRGGAGAQFQYGPPGMQPGVRGRPFGGHFSPHAQYQGPPMNTSGKIPWPALLSCCFYGNYFSHTAPRLSYLL
jgi:hypothetical protein